MRKIYLLIVFCLLGFTINKTYGQFSSGFELWTTVAPIEPTDWYGAKTSFTADSATQYTSAPHTGTYAIKLVSRSASQKRLTTQDQTIVAGNSYTMTFWVKGHGSIRTGIYTGGPNNATAYYYSSWLNINSSSWAQKTQVIISDTSSTSAEFILSVRNTLSDLEDIQVDDVNITTGVTPAVSIHDIQYATTSPYASAYSGQMVVTGGIVSAKYTNGMFIQSGYGPWSGLFVSDSAHIATAGIARGDSVTVTGLVSEVQTYTEIKTVSSITKVSSGNTLHAAYPVTTVNSGTEELEGVLVSLNNIPCVDATNAATLGEWIVFNGTDSTKIGGLLYKYTTATVGTHYAITGVVYESSLITRVEPRDVNDITNQSGITENTQTTISLFPNPVTSELNVNNTDGIQQVYISNVLGEKINTYAVSGSNLTLNVSNLPKGIYFISLIKDNTVVTTRKFVKL